MSVSVKNPKEITSYKEKVVGKLSLRQLISVGLIVIIVVIEMLIFHFFPLPNRRLQNLTVLSSVLLIGFFGFLEIEGESLEVYVQKKSKYSLMLKKKKLTNYLEPKENVTRKRAKSPQDEYLDCLMNMSDRTKKKSITEYCKCIPNEIEEEEVDDFTEETETRDFKYAIDKI